MAKKEMMVLLPSLDDVVIKVSIGIGRNLAEAEVALSVAKSRKAEGRYYNIERYGSVPLVCDSDVANEAVCGYLRLEDRLRRQGDSDALADLELLKCDAKTGLLNRMGYEVEVLRLRRRGMYRDRVIMLIDGDDMKLANSRLGYERTDRYLERIGSALKRQVRQQGSAACVGRPARSADILINRKNDSGGDEFIVDLECSVDEAEKVAQRYVRAIYAAQARLCDHNAEYA